LQIQPNFTKLFLKNQKSTEDSAFLGKLY